jgi:hypothetical protein
MPPPGQACEIGSWLLVGFCFGENVKQFEDGVDVQTQLKNGGTEKCAL